MEADNVGMNFQSGGKSAVFTETDQERQSSSNPVSSEWTSDENKQVAAEDVDETFEEYNSK